ncbi:fibril protein [Myxococcus vastator]|uniref:fibril protein n=1 Tax=Myxococcus vastator TaxID=2709664 RepID=UPI001F0829A4|nr:fibril protein [Myxococcus vastator]
MSLLRAACAGMLFLAACASTNKSAVPEPRASASTAPRVDVVKYGFHPQDPVRVGWGDRGLMAFLELLRGPQGQRIAWRRVGPCCGVGAPTELEVFEVTYDGLAAPVSLYLDPNTAGAVHAPNGFNLQGLASRSQVAQEETPRVIEL